jgi:molecular chaperone HtpG
MLFRTLGIPVAHGHRYAVVPFLRRWAQLRGLRLVELGTEQGNRQLFREAELPENEMNWLREHLCQGERLQPAYFEPAVLPLVVVPDRDSELKRRLDADANDKKISLAALRLARQFTAQIDASHDSRLYLNLSNPAVDALLKSLRAGSTQAAIGARLLRTFKTILASQDTQAADALGAALGDLAESVQALLRG